MERTKDYLMNHYMFVLQSPAEVRKLKNRLQNDYSISPFKLLIISFESSKAKKMVLCNFIAVFLLVL